VQLNAHFLKIPAPLCIIFGLIPQRNILKISVNFIMIDCLIGSDATWWKTTTCYYKLWFLAKS